MSTTKQEQSDTGRHREISTRLMDRTAAIERRLRARLQTVQATHDLDGRALLSSHREIGELAQLNIAPTAADFWATTANPRAQSLVAAASVVIDSEIDDFALALQRFERSVALVSDRAGYAHEPYLETVGTCVEQLTRAGLDRSKLDVIGARWHARLRRAAFRRSVFRLLICTPSEGQRLLAQSELELFDQAPWTHDDRLLSAFELAHADVRAYLRDRLSELSVIVPRQSVRELLTPG